MEYIFVDGWKGAAVMFTGLGLCGLCGWLMHRAETRFKEIELAVKPDERTIAPDSD